MNRETEFKNFVSRVDAALEFLPLGKPIAYDIGTEGIVLEKTNVDPNYIDVKERMDTVERTFGLDPYHDRFGKMGFARVLAYDVRCDVPWSTIMTEPNDVWFRRMGELQLHCQMAEVPDGYEFEFYPLPADWRSKLIMLVPGGSFLEDEK